MNSLQSKKGFRHTHPTPLHPHLIHTCIHGGSCNTLYHCIAYSNCYLAPQVGKPDWPRTNFDSIFQAIITVFQVGVTSVGAASVTCRLM